jgi:pimeloyl-ACP methyl ester carboxylesterase
MRYVVIDGQRLFYCEWDGDANDVLPPVVLVHGAGGTYLHWPPQLRRLRQIDVYGLDLPGHGRSGGQGHDSIAAYRDVVLGWVEALSLRRFVLVGHSMGGAIAQSFALEHANRLAGLVLVGSGARLRVHPAIQKGVQEDFPTAAKQISDWAYGASASETSRRQYLRRLLEVDPDVLLRDFRACDAFDVMERVGEIRVPTLAVCGMEDQMTPLKYSEFIQHRIPGAQMLRVEGAWHMAMLEKPGIVSSAIREFVLSMGTSGSEQAVDDQ